MTSGATDNDSGNLPVAQPFNPGVGDAGDPDRNIVFGSLVTADSDIVGLVAYSIYKQNKHDWLVAFEKFRGREPKDDELQSYIIGESTARRLATYRHLAQSTLDGNGPEVSTSPSTEGFSQRTYQIAQRHKAMAGSAGVNPAVKAVAYVVAAVVFVVAIYLAARYGLPGVSPARP